MHFEVGNKTNFYCTFLKWSNFLSAFHGSQNFSSKRNPKLSPVYKRLIKDGSINLPKEFEV